VSDKQNNELGDDFSYIIRIADTDIDGLKKLGVALTSIRGIGMRTAATICTIGGFDSSILAGHLSGDQQETLRSSIESYAEDTPNWMLNRQRDIETGDDYHLFGMDVKLTTGDDIDRLRATKAYRGVRHASGNKVRGQRGRSNGRSGLTLGVQRK
jgi:small subunit ribosomal protein S13